MIRHVWSVLCKEIIIDRASNLTSYINCLEQVSVKSLPVKIDKVNIGVFVYVDPIEVVRIRVQLRAPNGEIKPLVETKDNKFTVNRNRVNFIIGNLEFKEPGIHEFMVEYKIDKDWLLLNELPLDVKNQTESN